MAAQSKSENASSMAPHPSGSDRSWPARGWIGLALALLFWILNWTLSGLRTHWGFFPMWLGYCLAVDALVWKRKGSSLFIRSPARFVALFLISAPAWWLFELINWRTENWRYLGRVFFSNIEYVLLASLSFSTVIPAVFGTAELAATFSWIKRLRPGPIIAPHQRIALGMFWAGWIMFGLLLLWPRYFFPFVWGSSYLILEPINIWRGRRSLLQYTAQGDWRPILALSMGCLLCGFFWEMWNFYSYPKWIYQVPYLGFLRVFEMPLLGYLGYVPFAWELFALYHLVSGLLRPRGREDYVQLS